MSAEDAHRSQPPWEGRGGSGLNGWQGGGKEVARRGRKQGFDT